MELAVSRFRRIGFLARHAEADLEAFTELYDEYLPRVFGYIACRVGSEGLAEELTATTFEKALRKLGSYRRDKGAFSTWLFTIARHVVTDHFRTHGRRVVVSLEEVPELATVEGLPEEECLRREEFARLYACLAALPEREQEIISLRFMSGLSNQRVAEIMGLSESHVGVIVHRTLRKLRKMMEEES